MLYPRMQTVSQKGQMVIPSDFRQAFGVQAGTIVLLIPDLIQKQGIIRSLATNDPVAAGFGMFSREKSLTKSLLKAKKQEILLENKKYD